MAQFRQVIRLRPTYAHAYANLSKALTGQGRFDENLRVLREGLTRVPGHVGLSILLAEALATCPDADLRDSTEAVRLAEQVCRKTGFRVPQALNALAAAYAEAGRFGDAIQQAERAVALAGSAGQDGLRQQIASRLELYRAHQAAR